jgi:hypothetical protein
VANALAYHGAELITAVKSFIELALEKAVTHCSQKKEIEQCTIKKKFHHIICSSAQ